jgi:hypothetical protein
VKEESEAHSLQLTRPFWWVIRMARSKGDSQEMPMNSGIVRNTLTTTLALELEYREPAIEEWEYRCYAAWDPGFHCIPLAMVDSDFSNEQLTLTFSEWYQL